MCEKVSTKICPRCKTEKPVGAFGKCKSREGGLQVYCKQCKGLADVLYHKSHKEEAKIYRRSHKEQRTASIRQWKETHKEQEAATHKRYRETHKEEMGVYNKQYKKTHKEEAEVYIKQWSEAHKEQRATTKRRWDEAHKEQIATYYETHKEERNCYFRERAKSNPNFRIAHCVRSRLNKAIRGGYKAGSAVRDCGCSMDFLKAYLESQFWPEMTWKNQGKNGWHIDHIVPLKTFNLEDREQFLKANHYTNLQPLWYDDNQKKKHRLDWSPLESKHRLPIRLINPHI